MSGFIKSRNGWIHPISRIASIRTRTLPDNGKTYALTHTVEFIDEAEIHISQSDVDQIIRTDAPIIHVTIGYRRLWCHGRLDGEAQSWTSSPIIAFMLDPVLDGAVVPITCFDGAQALLDSQAIEYPDGTVEDCQGSLFESAATWFASREEAEERERGEG